MVAKLTASVSYQRPHVFALQLWSMDLQRGCFGANIISTHDLFCRLLSAWDDRRDWLLQACHTYVLHKIMRWYITVLSRPKKAQRNVFYCCSKIKSWYFGVSRVSPFFICHRLKFRGACYEGICGACTKSATKQNWKELALCGFIMYGFVDL